MFIATLFIRQQNAHLCSASELCPTLLQPRELKPTRLLYQWDFPGKNTGVGCHSPGDLPDPGIKPMSLTSPALAGVFFTTEPHGKPKYP